MHASCVDQDDAAGGVKNPVNKENSSESELNSDSELFSDNEQVYDKYQPQHPDSYPLKTNIKKTLKGVGIILGIGTTWYYYDQTNKRDQFFNSGQEIKNRFKSFDSWKFDDNYFETNSVSHSFAGSGYYLSARVSNYNQYQSFLFAVGGSLFWEYFCEFQEIISINDMLYTPLGGFAIGESIFQLLNIYADNAQDSWLRQLILANTISQNGRYNKTINGGTLPSPYWHNLYVFGGGSITDSDHYTAHIGMNTEFYGARRVKQTGRMNGFYANSPYTKIQIDLGAGNQNLKNIYLNFETGHLSYVNQHINRASTGYAFIATLSTAIEYDYYDLNVFTDRTGSLHPLKLNTDLLLTSKNFSINFNATVSAVFSQVQSYGAYEMYLNGYAPEYFRFRGNRVLAREGYYYAYGAARKAAVTVAYKMLEVGGSIARKNYKSINTDGWINREDATGESVSLKDTRSVYTCWASYELPRNLRVSTQFIRRDLYGFSDNFSRSGSENAFKMLTMYQFN
ncbi:MAG: DUF3943 domain-containing protein [Spirochaetes bacterium]|nr:DUF3943 domain-containing protein [Spirochaetota bacterium]